MERDHLWITAKDPLISLSLLELGSNLTFALWHGSPQVFRLLSLM